MNFIELDFPTLLVQFSYADVGSSAAVEGAEAPVPAVAPPDVVPAPAPAPAPATGATLPSTASLAPGAAAEAVDAGRTCFLGMHSRVKVTSSWSSVAHAECPMLGNLGRPRAHTHREQGKPTSNITRNDGGVQQQHSSVRDE